MMFLTASALPPEFRLVHIHGLVCVTRAVEISSKGIVRGLFERRRNEFQEVYDALAAEAKGRGNVIYAIQTATATQHFGNNTYLYVTLSGTVATCDIPAGYVGA
ncbi:MAG: hypothetical protein Q4G25_13950 [Paracoccus sp. (in: a-proteobacteria)]|nr:hypothetical protein [Paracoccus sp. (in: a-proteobacteria)]